MAENVLQVKIISPTQTIFEGEAVSISSVNSLGKFDILPFHANFISLVRKDPIIVRTKKAGSTQTSLPAKALDQFFGRDIEETKYEFDIAIVFAKDNLVKIYTQIQLQF